MNKLHPRQSDIHLFDPELVTIEMNKLTTAREFINSNIGHFVNGDHDGPVFPIWSGQVPYDIASYREFPDIVRLMSHKMIPGGKNDRTTETQTPRWWFAAAHMTATEYKSRAVVSGSNDWVSELKLFAGHSALKAMGYVDDRLQTVPIHTAAALAYFRGDIETKLDREVWSAMPEIEVMMFDLEPDEVVLAGLDRMIHEPIENW